MKRLIVIMSIFLPGKRLKTSIAASGIPIKEATKTEDRLIFMESNTISNKSESKAKINFAAKINASLRSVMNN